MHIGEKRVGHVQKRQPFKVDTIHRVAREFSKIGMLEVNLLQKIFMLLTFVLKTLGLNRSHVTLTPPYF